MLGGSTADKRERLFDLDDRAGFLLWQGLLLGFVLLCFIPGIDNFFADDDFEWLFDTKKMLLHPPHVLEHSNHSYFFRPTESLYFVLCYLIGGFNHIVYQAAALLIHLVNVALLSLVIGRLTTSRLAGLLGAFYWALSYQHVEAVFRPYGVADSLALLGCLAAFALMLRDRPGWASCCFLFGLLAKENAALFPVVITAGLVVAHGPPLRRRLAQTSPLWVMSAVVGSIGLLIRSQREGDGYLTFDWAALSRFWEAMLGFLGPDPTYIRMVHLDGRPTLIPVLLAMVLFVILAVALWKAPRIVALGLVWMAVMSLPTVFVAHQASRYSYIPLAGLGLVVGYAVERLLAQCELRERSILRLLIIPVFALVMLYHIVGINVQEQDFDYLGRLHQQAAASFRQEVVPHMPLNDHTVVLFLKPDSTPIVEDLYAQYLLKPWYLPTVYRWVYRRHAGVLGLTNTYGFVSFCTHRRAPDTLFVHVPFEEYRERVLAGDYYIVSHDYRTNTFRLVPSSEVGDLVQRVDDQQVFRFLQPGRFDSSHRGGIYF